MTAYEFKPMLTLQCKLLFWWENISSGVELRSGKPTERGELKAYLLSVVGRKKGLTRRDLPRLRFSLNRKDTCPKKDCLRVLLIGNWVCGARYAQCTDGAPTPKQIRESDSGLTKMHAEDIRRAAHRGMKWSIVDLSI